MSCQPPPAPRPDAAPDDLAALATAALHIRYRTCGLRSEQDAILSELARRQPIPFDQLPPARFTQGDAP